MNAQQVAEKWQRRTQGAIQDYRAGVEAVTDSPMAKAASNPEKYLEGVRKAVQDGKWQGGLNRVTLAEWKKLTLEKGAPRISAGVDGAVPKMQAFMADFLPFLENVRSQVDAMPDVTLEDSIARMTAQVRAVAGYRRSA